MATVSEKEDQETPEKEGTIERVSDPEEDSKDAQRPSTTRFTQHCSPGQGEGRGHGRGQGRLENLSVPVEEEVKTASEEKLVGNSPGEKSKEILQASTED